MDTVTTRTPVLLEGIQKKNYNVTTSEDPVIKALSQSENKGNIYITDRILSLIMSSPKSIYSWDVVITNDNGVLYFDKRDGTIVDQYTVDETAKDPIDTEDSTANLHHESFSINRAFQQQSVTGDVEEYGKNPFALEGENPASIGYKYKKFTLGDSQIVCRCEVDAFLVKEKQYSMTIRAFNEYSLGGFEDWRNNLYDHPTSVLMSEVDKNSVKVSRWAIEAMLAGNDYIGFGFISRTKQRGRHQILSTQTYSTESFAQQIDISQSNSWGIFMAIVEEVLKLGSGKFLLMKEPILSSLKLYSIPKNTVFEDEKLDSEEKKE